MTTDDEIYQPQPGSEESRTGPVSIGTAIAAAMRVVEQRVAQQEALQQEITPPPDREAEQARHLALARLHAFNVPTKDARRLIDGPLHETKIMVALRESLAAGKLIIVLSGGNGCGKTTAAAWAVMQGSPRKYKYAPFGTRPVWPSDLHPGFLAVSDLQCVSLYDAEAQKPLKTCQLLAIDDLGMERLDAAGVFLTVLDGLIDARYREELVTVITTNMAGEPFAERYGNRIRDRWRECGVFFESNDVSLRGRP